MKLIYFTDSHIMGRNPGSRIDDYPQALYRTFLEIEQTARTEKPTAIIHGGDFFDQPRIADSIKNKYIRILKRINKICPVYLVPGNHDLFGYSMKTIDQTAIGILARSGMVRLLTRSKNYTLKDGNVKVAIHGYEYHKDIDKEPLLDYQIQEDPNANHNFLFSHGMLLEKPFHPDVPCTLTKDVYTDADLVLNGHYHPGMPIHQHNGTTFGNPGSTGRVEASKDGMSRMPQYAIIDADTKNFAVTYHEYQCAEPGDKVFDRSQITTKKEEKRYLEAFEQTVQDALTFEAYNPRDVLAKLAKSGKLATSIVKDAENMITGVESSDKDNKLDGFVEKKKPIAITEIELTNFQSHKHTVVKLNDKGLNALTGQSDSGKSAIVRGLRWVLYNEPKGTDFIRHGESRATVTVTFSDGSYITRTRTNSSAGEYIVCDGKGKSEEFKGFGNNIPIDIANVHQMPKVELSTGIERPLNFSYQLDGHFLLSDSPQVRASTIGRLTGVQTVDAAIKDQYKKIRQIGTGISSDEARITEIESDIQKYDDLPDIKKQLDQAQALMIGIESLNKEVDELTNLQIEYKDMTDDCKTLKNNLNEYKDLQQAELLLDKAELQSDELDSLKVMHQDYRQSKKEISLLKADLLDYNELPKAETELNKAEALVDEITELKKLLEEEQVLADEENELEDELIELEREFDLMENDMKELMEELGNKCPTCHQNVGEHEMKEMLEHV